MNKKFLVTLLFALIGGAVSAFVVVKTTNKSTEITLNELAHNQSQYHLASLEDQSTSQNTSSTLPDLTYAAERAVQAVVGIEKKEMVEQSAQGGMYGMDPFFEFFGIPQQQQQQQRGGAQQRMAPQERRSGGSGVIISPDGYIVTNNHVIENASELRVTLSDERTYTAKLIGTDPTTDIALIKIDEKELPTIVMGNSEKLKLGEWVVAVGNPYGLNSTVTAGIVSAKGRNLDVIADQFRLESFIQTDAAINPGNSGGALVNIAGELIGINTVIKSPTGSYAGYAFAVPSDMVKKVVTDLSEYGFVQRALLGIAYREINSDFIEQEGEKTAIKEKGGLYIATVEDSGAAAAAGIKVGDILIAIDGTKIDRSSQLQSIIAQHRPNDKLNITIKRAGEVKQIEVVLRNKAGEAKLLDKSSVDVVASLGGKFAPISEKAKKVLKLDYGVQVTEVGTGLLKRSGIRQGYIITHINGVPMRSLTDLNKISDSIQTIDGLYTDGRYVSYSIVNNTK